MASIKLLTTYWFTKGIYNSFQWITLVETCKTNHNWNEIPNLNATFIIQYKHLQYRLITLTLVNECGNNCYSNRSNNPQDWLDGWTILVSSSNDLLSSIIIQIHHINLCITFIPINHPKFIISPSFHHSQNHYSSNLKHTNFIYNSFIIPNSCYCNRGGGGG